MKKVLGVIVPVALVAFGIGLIIAFTRASESATQTSGWRQAAGVVDRVGVGDAEEVAYHYKVEGSEHRGTQAIANRRDRYRAGQALIVYVNPTLPTESRLEPAPHPSPWLWIGGTFSILVAATLASYSRFAKRRPLPKKRPHKKSAPKPNVPRKSAPMSRLRPPAPLKRFDADETEPSGETEDR